MTSNQQIPDEFRADNTEGYTVEQLSALNAEWRERVVHEQLDIDDLTYDAAVKAFSDEVARR